MIRTGEFKTAALRVVTLTSVALLLAMPRAAAAQTPPTQTPPAQQQDDPLKLSTSSPTIILMHINTDKTADFEAAWGKIRAALAKSENADVKAYGETLSNLFKVDMPTDGKTVVYMLRLDAPSTAISYHPFKLVYEQLWNADEKLSLIPRPEADALFETLKASFANINPPWKLVKVG